MWIYTLSNNLNRTLVLPCRQAPHQCLKILLDFISHNIEVLVSPWILHYSHIIPPVAEVFLVMKHAQDLWHLLEQWMKSTYLSIFRVLSDMSLTAHFWEDRNPLRTSASGTMHNFKRQWNVAKYKFPFTCSTSPDFWKAPLSTHPWSNWDHDLRFSLDMGLKAVSHLNEHLFSKCSLTPLTPVVKHLT